MEGRIVRILLPTVWTSEGLHERHPILARFTSAAPPWTVLAGGLIPALVFQSWEGFAVGVPYAFIYMLVLYGVIYPLTKGLGIVGLWLAVLWNLVAWTALVGGTAYMYYYAINIDPSMTHWPYY